MGQYHVVVNLDRREVIQPHKLGCGLKLWEQLANHPGTGAALIVLLASASNGDGGGDLDVTANWHGPERTGPDPGPMPESYPDIAKRTIGRWRGNRIAMVGDYDDDSSYETLGETMSGADIYTAADDWTDVSDDVGRVIEHELRGKYEGGGWQDWKAA